MHPSSTLMPALQHNVQQRSIHEIFARHALVHPDAIALIWHDKETTYAKLNSFANSAAAELLSMGITPGTCVPIMLPRGPELVISLLAILKVGAAYALLDHTWPEGRLLEIFETLSPPLLITWSSPAAAGIIPIWSPVPETLVEVFDFNPVTVDDSSPCCVFFTSGTTGRPKGVLSPHRATTRLFQENSFARFSSNTVIPLAASLAWDAFSLELWGALLNGGTSWILDEPYLSADALRNGIFKYKVDTVWMTSSLFNMIIEEDLSAFNGLQQVMTGGEPLSIPHIQQFLYQHPTITLINGYGPVESTVFATTHRITLDDCLLPDGIPIGRSIACTQVYILNNQRLCKEGEIGEIYIAGNGLALRYIDDPLLTEEKFIQIEINGIQTRVYRSGDLGFLNNGLLHFKGRADRQVKIRGHRVELTEVEHQIKSLVPAVRSCRVVARRNAINVVYELIVFCIPTVYGDMLDNVVKILRSKLVSYQCPSAVVSVKAFPLTSQGKLDEQALMAMLPLLSTESSLSSPSLQYDDPIIALVAGTFAAVLNLIFVPLDIPFLELGGTSLDIGRICARLKGKLGRAVPVSWLYRYPTVTSLTYRLREIDKNISSAQMVDFNEIPLNSMQLTYLTRHFINPTDCASHCCMVWLIRGALDLRSLEAAIDYVHQRHEALRAAYVADPKPTVIPIDVSAPQLKRLPTQPTVEDALNALRANFMVELEPTTGDIWRTAIVPVNASNIFVFGCVIHHIAFDGWSELVFASDLAAGYNSSQGTAALSFPTLSLAAAYKTQESFLAEAYTSDHDEFLIKELADVPALEWPIRQKDLDIGDLGCNEVSILLTRDLIRMIDMIAADVCATRFEILFAYWARALTEVTRQDDFCIGVPVRQRCTPDLDHVLGCYMNVVCIRIRSKALRSDLDGLKKVSRIVQRAFAAQEVPLKRVLQLANPQHKGRSPLFQTLFALHDNPIPHLYMDGLDSTFLRQPYLGVPLELHAEIWPEGEGCLRLAISRRPERVSAFIVDQLAQRFTELLSVPMLQNSL